MIPAADVARARSRIAEVIGAEVELKKAGHELCGLCPFHAEKSPSFYIFSGEHFHCFGCGAHGDAIGFVMRFRNLDFLDAVRWLLDLPEIPRGLDKRPITQGGGRGLGPSASVETAASLDRVKAILAECGPVVERTAARMYLWSRGLKPDQPALLAHPALYCSEIGKPLPALVAPLTDSRGEVTAIQRIWCVDRMEYVNGEGPQDARAPLATRKKTLGAMGDSAVRLAPPAAILGLAEGVESAIAASMLYRIPVWAVCGAARLGHAWLPPAVTTVFIFGDNGATGPALALHARELRGPRVACNLVFPAAPFGDFADQLIGRRAA